MGQLTLLGAGKPPSGAAPLTFPTGIFGGGAIGGRWRFDTLSEMWQTVTGTSQVASAGDPIGQVDDISGQSPALTTPMRAAANNSTRPTYVSGGGAQFTAANNTFMKNLLSANYTGTTAYAWIACKPNSSSETDARIFNMLHTDAPAIDYDAVTKAIFAYKSTGGQWAGYRNGVKSITTAWTSDTKYLFESKYDGTNHTFYKNTSGETPVASSGSFLSNHVSIGALDGDSLGGTAFQGVIYEIGWCSTIPSGADITALQAYLNQQYTLY